jgi:hypothetical protein
MTQEDYLNYHAELCNMARRLSHSKNNDYSAPDARQGDKYPAFANFMQAERLGICSVEAGIMVRLSDKMSRLANLIRPGHKRAVYDERIHDTILDGINYLCILAAYLDCKTEEESGNDHSNI